MYGSIGDEDDSKLYQYNNIFGTYSHQNESDDLLDKSENNKSQTKFSKISNIVFFIIINCATLFFLMYINIEVRVSEMIGDVFTNYKYDLLYMTISDIFMHMSYTIPYTIIFPELSRHIYMLPFAMSLFARLVYIFTTYTVSNEISKNDSFDPDPYNVHKLIGSLLIYGNIFLIIPFYVYHNVKQVPKYDNSIRFNKQIIMTIIIVT